MKFRNEYKYYVNYQDYSVLKVRLKALLEKDPHSNTEGFYNVRSLYFEDLFNRAYEDKQIGIMNRSKYRIRIYNHSDQVINLERKIKTNNFISKQIAPLSVEEVGSILDKDFGFLLLSSHNLHKVFYYQCVSKFMRPRIVVDYEREAFIFKNGNIRITFDKNVRAGLQGFDLFDDGMPMAEALEPGLLIMEVKFSEFLPNMIREMLPSKASDRAAISKYVLCCDRAMHKKFSYY